MSCYIKPCYNKIALCIVGYSASNKHVFFYFIDSPATARFKSVAAALHGSVDIQTQTTATDEEGCAAECMNSPTCSGYKMGGSCELYFSGNVGGSLVNGVKLKKQPSPIQLHSGNH